MVKYSIEQELANDILDYLAMRPYKEVAELIEGMRKLEKIEAAK